MYSYVATMIGLYHIRTSSKYRCAQIAICGQGIMNPYHVVVVTESEPYYTYDYEYQRLNCDSTPHQPEVAWRRRSRNYGRQFHMYNLRREIKKRSIEYCQLVTI